MLRWAQLWLPAPCPPPLPPPSSLPPCYATIKTCCGCAVLASSHGCLHSGTNTSHVNTSALALGWLTLGLWCCTQRPKTLFDMLLLRGVIADWCTHSQQASAVFQLAVGWLASGKLQSCNPSHSPSKLSHALRVLTSSFCFACCIAHGIGAAVQYCT